MGKRKTTSNEAKSNGNKVIINNYPAPPPPVERISWPDLLQSKDADLKQAENLINLLQAHIEKQNQELARLRNHIAEKDTYISMLLFRRA
jgi:hypothetical protein